MIILDVFDLRRISNIITKPAYQNFPENVLHICCIQISHLIQRQKSHDDVIHV